MNANSLSLTASVLCTVLGIVMFWPFTVAGILCAALTRHPVAAVGLGLLADILYGAPVGVLHFFFFPFTLLALFCIGAPALGRRYLFANEENRLS